MRDMDVAPLSWGAGCAMTRAAGVEGVRSMGREGFTSCETGTWVGRAIGTWTGCTEAAASETCSDSTDDSIGAEGVGVIVLVEVMDAGGSWDDDDGASMAAGGA